MLTDFFFFFQLPHNSNNIIRQTCEPIYSTKNEILSTANAATVPLSSSSSPLIAHSKLQQHQNLIRSNKQSHYSNMEMTLDNPAILNQQLEALEHHKKQLEMKGMLPVSSSSSSSPLSTKYSNNVKSAIEKFQNPNETSNNIDSPSAKMHVYSNTSVLKSKIPPPLLLPSSSSSPSSATTLSSSSESSTSSSSSGLNLKKNSDIVYSNILHQQNTSSIHPPILTPSSSSSIYPPAPPPPPPHPNQIYSNISYNAGIGM